LALFQYNWAITLALLMLSIPANAQAASYDFLWTGANGYKMMGAISIPDDLTKAGHIDESAVDCFWIKGLRNNKAIGQWSLGELTPETSWNLNFEPVTLRFRTGGHTSSTYGQEWNMDGGGRNCGIGSFGFNVGSAAQDICINSRLIWASQVPPKKPLTVTRNDKIKFEAADCVFLPVS